MSYTAVYTKLQPLANSNVRSNGAAILDKDLWYALHDDSNFEFATIIQDAVTDEEHRGGYPQKKYTTLKGFKTWTPDDVLRNYDSLSEAAADLRGDAAMLGFDYNIERLGVEYARGKFLRFWSVVSEAAEPFQFYQSPVAHNFPDVTDVVRDGSASVYRVTCIDGDVTIHEHEVEYAAGEVEATYTPDRSIADHINEGENDDG